MTVLVGGGGRNSGKTTVVCAIVAATPEASWTAIKITSHGHGDSLEQPIMHVETDREARTDTSRYLAAGACRALWMRCNRDQIGDALSAVRDGNVIIESNSAVEFVDTDVIIYVACSDPKPSAQLVRERAQVQVSMDVYGAAIEAVVGRLGNCALAGEPTS